VEGKDGTFSFDVSPAAAATASSPWALEEAGPWRPSQHWRDKNGHYGRCDGIWDRKHCPKQRA